MPANLELACQNGIGQSSVKSKDTVGFTSIIYPTHDFGSSSENTFSMSILHTSYMASVRNLLTPVRHRFGIDKTKFSWSVIGEGEFSAWVFIDKTSVLSVSNDQFGLYDSIMICI